ncbi:cytokine receptor common subunit beta isoform X2 [Antennarius striatus]|uniref:cytokine receptor common subunit beta isoform X2 n=1 Tax=Antennarius striatus TaxID=241820 RepID=UPI0035AFC7A9
MLLFWVMIWSLLRPLACDSVLDRCVIQENSSKSPLLKSLQCYNDYKSYVHCQWSEHMNATLQLWFKEHNHRQQCLPYDAADQHHSHRSEYKTVQCRYNTGAFSIGIKHVAFFLETNTETLCSSASRKPLDLSQHLRSRPPVDVAVHDAGDGGWWLSWSSPYPSSSTLNNDVTYQPSYRTDGQDDWMTENVASTSVKLEERLLIPGRRYEFRVRALASVGQWSHWSPAVTWQTEDTWQSPSLHCVLDGDKEVMCSWEVSRELAHFVSYQLACHGNQAAPDKRCCVSPTETSDPSSSLVKYSCSLTASDPALLQLELVPTRNSKVFKAHKHIRPNSPQQVKVREKGANWIVEWTESSTASEVKLYYQLCYYRAQDQECSIRNISGSTSVMILGASLAPSQDYKVKVRSLVIPGEDSIYGGFPSEWTNPVDWKSHEATWSLTTLIYCFISVTVAIVFLTAYFTIQACRRKVTLWVDSLPSPGKSKTLSEIKPATRWTLQQTKNTSTCKVQHVMVMLSTRSSDDPPWPRNDSEKESLEQGKGCRECDILPCLTKKVNISSTSSVSFSGPYIFCQTTESEKEKETLLNGSASSSPENVMLYGKDYVRLPSHTIFRSKQDLVNTNTQRQGTTEQDQHHSDTIQWPYKMDDQSGINVPANSSGPFPSWPQEESIQPSGYCHLPTAHMVAV